MLKNTPMGVHAKEDPWSVTWSCTDSIDARLTTESGKSQVHEQSRREAASEAGTRRECAAEEYHYHAAELRAF